VKGETLRVVTYNVHRCKGLDGPRAARPRGEGAEGDRRGHRRAAGGRLHPGGEPEGDQAHYLAREIGADFLFGENRKLWGGAYGNVVLSKLPMRTVKNHDLSVRGRERRGCLHIDVDLAGRVLHVFNVHLGTAFLERRKQGRKLAGLDILLNNELKGPRLLLGDFNEWAPGLTTKLLRAHMQSVDIKKHLRRRRTYPACCRCSTSTTSTTTSRWRWWG
jgi:endonuclease/exonuclease/phosphatase family metal-dependent hydrolase